MTPSWGKGDIYLAVNPLSEGGSVREPWPTQIVLRGTKANCKNSERVALSDVDGDGLSDIVFSRVRPRQVFVLFNSPGETATGWSLKVIGSHGGDDSHSVEAADLDNDGDLDILSAVNHGRPRNLLWFENPDGDSRHTTWRRRVVGHVRGAGGSGATQIIDLNSDGWLDVIATEAHGLPGRVLWFENPKRDTKRAWKSHLIGRQTYPHETALIDVDGDGLDELLVPDGSFETTGKGPYGLRNGGIVYFKRTESPETRWEKCRVAELPAVGRRSYAVDVDEDGDLDFISTGDHDHPNNVLSLVWWENKRN